jgi:hypothetical protein
MKQALLYSDTAQNVFNVLNGDKTIEVRKRDLPKWAKDKLARGDIVEGYGYCTKGKPILSNYYDSIGGNYTFHSDYSEHFLGSKETQSPYILNGRVVVKFEVSGTTRYVDCSGCTNNENGYECQNDFMYLLSVDPTLRKATSLTADEIEEYGNGKDLYAHHLSDITPVEMELGEFFNDCGRIDTDEHGREIGWHDVGINPLTKAPQSFQTVWVKGE